MSYEVDFWALRPFFKQPAEPVLRAARLLNEAVAAHRSGAHEIAESLIRDANDPAIYEWTQSIMGARIQEVLRVRDIEGAPKYLAKEQRLPPRQPPTAIKHALLERDGLHCRFCGMPVIRAEVRTAMEKIYPHALPWTDKLDKEKHAAFLCMWVQYDHIVPHSRGGATTLENMVITCAPCNYGRWHNTLEEVGLLHPFLREPLSNDWDGLERFHAAF